MYLASDRCRGLRLCQEHGPAKPGCEVWLYHQLQVLKALGNGHRPLAQGRGNQRQARAYPGRVTNLLDTLQRNRRQHANSNSSPDIDPRAKGPREDNPIQFARRDANRA